MTQQYSAFNVMITPSLDVAIHIRGTMKYTANVYTFPFSLERIDFSAISEFIKV